MIYPIDGTRSERACQGVGILDCNREIVQKELSKEPVGSNRKCAYYPCHHEGQDCTFCYCPFYPCNDTELGGKEVTSRRGGTVWSCMGCHFMHDKDVTEYVHHRLRIIGFEEDTDLSQLLRDVKELFFYPDRERWSRMEDI